MNDVRKYRYYKEQTRGLDFEGFIEDLKVSRYCDRLGDAQVCLVLRVVSLENWS
jgi:aspartate/tyrosine/aromatic aminotransferase